MKKILSTLTACFACASAFATGTIPGVTTFGTLAQGARPLGLLDSSFGAVKTYIDSSVSISVGNPIYGATGNGVTDDCLTAIPAAYAAAAAIGNATLYFPPAVAYKCNEGLPPIDTNKVSVDFGGNEIDFSGMTSGNALSIINSNADANVRMILNHAHPIRNGFLFGPGLATTAVTAIYVNDATSVKSLSGNVFEDMSIVNFANDAYLGVGVFAELFKHINFTVLSGTATTPSISIPTATNAGEKNVFDSCFWNNRDYVLNQSNQSADTVFSASSIDGSPTNVFTITGGLVTVGNGSHIEQGADAGYWFSVTGTNSGLRINDSMIIAYTNKSAYAPFYSDSTSTQNGITLRNNYIVIGGTFTPFLVAGTGKTNIQYNNFEGSAVLPNASAWQNYLAYGGFESANFTVEWSLTGNTPPARSTDYAHSGTNSLKFSGSSTNTPQAILTMPISPGQYVMGSLWYYPLTLTGTSGTFYVEVDWLDKGGNILGSSIALADTTSSVGWVKLALNNTTSPAPNGSVSYRLLVNIFGTVTGTSVGYIDDVNLWAE